MFEFSNRSEERLQTCHGDLVIIMRTAITTSQVDFGIAEGHRSLEAQMKAYADNKSRLDGINKKSKHQSYPSMAVDIYAFVKGKANWEDINLAYLGGHIMAVAALLYNTGHITHRLRWGGNWDMDGEIVYDQKLKDLPHFELV